jgi:polysaccharide export outer membrane protein
MYCRLYCSAWVLVLFMALAQSVAATEEPTRSYPLQPGDLLRIQVWGEPELNYEVLIAPDGAFSFPLVGSILATGRNADDVQAEVKQRLDKYIPDPNVTLSIINVSGNVIYVLGQVNRPGLFPMSGPINVAQALSLAGGMTPFAGTNDIRILRKQDGKQTSLEFRYSDIAKGVKLEQNIDLVSGDVVIVP